MSLTPASLGFRHPTDDEVKEVIKRIIAQEYNGQKVVLERTVGGNVGRELQKDGRKVIIPGPIRFGRLVKQVTTDQWAVFVQNNFHIEVYAPDVVTLPSKV